MTRHEMREAALLILFQMRLNDSTEEELLQDNVDAFELEYNSNSLKLVNGVLENDALLTEIIAKYSPSRAVDRISLMNRTIMQIALYEMKFCPSVPDKVAINEAVELSKEYCQKNDTAFINGVLSSYYKENGDE
ncbi:MAG: transcription antitermination factor NusB [Eubacterium sp.]|nr:transcription antitermination factor NusB [Eubacterium sp.]